MKHIPVRSCVVCRAQKDKADLLRIVKTPSGEVVFDVTGKAQGRGAYICKSGDCVKLAAKKRALDRAYKTKLDDEVYARLTEQFEQTEGND